MDTPPAPTDTRQDAPAPAPEVGEAVLVGEELLIEEISIDGMCGVY